MGAGELGSWGAGELGSWGAGAGELGSWRWGWGWGAGAGGGAGAGAGAAAGALGQFGVLEANFGLWEAIWAFAGLDEFIEALLVSCLDK